MAKWRTKLGVVIALAATVALPAAARKKPNATALALFQKAIAASDIEAKGAPAFRLQAEVHVFGLGGKVEGMAVKFWAPGENWRTETMLPGYNRVDGRNKNTFWVKSSRKYAPYFADAIWRMLDFPQGLQTAVKSASLAQGPRLKMKPRGLKRLPTETTRHGKTRTSEHAKRILASRVDTGSGPSTTQYYFDPKTGRLIEEWDGFVELRYLFSNYQPFGAKSFPRTIRVYYANGKEMLEVDVTGIVRLPKPNPSLFAAVAGATEVRGSDCWNILLGKQINPLKKMKLTNMVQPPYPEKAKNDYTTGSVIMAAVIASDGTVHNVWMLESPSPLLTQPALWAVRQWRFQPTKALCGEPIPVDTVIRIVFTLGQ